MVKLLLPVWMLLLPLLLTAQKGYPLTTVMQAKNNDHMTYPVKFISVSIRKPVAEVYAYASHPENMPRWAHGLVRSIHKEGALWIGESVLGKIKVRFTPPNDFGILDHDVTLESGETIANPMRVIPNHEGAELVFTLFWLPGRTEAQFKEDAGMVQSDLERLKALLE